MTTLKPATSVWVRPLDFSAGGMLEAVTKLIVDAKVGNLGGVATGSITR
jgi:hypothetical protein